MKLFVLPVFIILFAVFFPNTKIIGQVNEDDSVFYQAAVQNAISFYQHSTQGQPRIYNGRQYKPYRFGFINGTPFFESNHFAKGDVVYEGGSYKNVQLLYDQVTDMLILQAVYAIELINERVTAFSLAGHTFTRLVRDSVNKLPATGYYEKLYAGKIEILKKEKKSIKEDITVTDGVRGDISSKKYYYLKKGEQYHYIKNKRTVLVLLNDRASEIEQFIKFNHLNFKRDKDNTLAKIAGYYDQLTR